MSPPLPLSATGRLPAPGDNVAIAIRQLDAGAVIDIDGGPRPLAQTVLEGHRFAVRPIALGEPLLSWGLPFGHALTPIAPGDYVCNRSILEALAVRGLPFPLPAQPNFADHLVPFEFNEAAFTPAPPVPLEPQPRTFDGYRRPGRRGVGTRNYIVVLGTTSRTASFARQLAARLQPLARVHPALDGLVAVAHTEGGGPGEPNNSAEVLRALAGFLVHPNVGAVLAVDYGSEPISNARLAAFMWERGYPLADVPHHFLSIRAGLAAALAEGEGMVRRWLPVVAAQRRTPEPLSGLRVALQCGGSDAFSGVSANPLAGAIVHEVVRHGGIGVLCETDELSGAESYLMKNLRDADLARALLARVERFRARLGWHGVTPEGNPSAGNKFRGLYNITLKSLGAVHKKDPRTRVDHVIDYADPLGGPGFYFMDSPGNDLEGIAGQVGAGCNLFLFATGSGSITNFPFVPTLKLTTTTRRHQLLVHEMDINAGRYLDGEAMASLAAESFDLVVATASGQRSRGEHAGHSQVSLWRNWRQTDSSHVAAIRARPAPDSQPLEIAFERRESHAEPPPLAVFMAGERFATERVGLVLPTSMCSAQIARLAAERMNAKGLAAALGFKRFIALAHSEGCGFGGESMYHLLHRTYRGYATHPNVAAALLLEHGCEKIPNDAMRRQFEIAGLPLERFGWASVQLDGGIDQALGNVEAWFTRAGPAQPAARRVPVGLGALTVGLLAMAPVGRMGAVAVLRVARTILDAGGSVLLPEGDPLLAVADFRKKLLGLTLPHATLAYGQPFSKPGLHLVATDSDHWVENLAGLGACGVHVFLGLVGDSPQQGHPMLPVLQVAERAVLPAAARQDVDVILNGDIVIDEAVLLRVLCDTAQGDYTPVASAGGFVDFQLSRGLLGVST
ncbi:MAG: UxaA family hydrolase [Lacunisphaera sp.]|nr:UxaA family hydrolase [Lacunisphaera sp.]